jgi:nitrilase
MTKIAIIQHAPIVLNREATLEKACRLIAESAASGAQLIVFPEAFVPGYPAWVWRLRPGSDWGLSETLHQRLLENAVDLARGDLQSVQVAARESSVTVVMGINERDGQLGRTTLYNSAVVIGPDGELLNHHRKLMPTNPERMVWGFGDASGLKVVDTPVGRIGVLLCWENYMPLARFALYAQGIDIHIAPTYDSGEAWLGTLQHIAREGGCWVIGAGVSLHRRDLPDDFPDRDALYPAEEEWINPGDSVVVAPGGELMAGPLHEQQEILYAEIDPARAAIARRTFDVAGHYSRPDIFTLKVNRQQQSPIEFET